MDYVYRITAKARQISGQSVHQSQYAFKPGYTRDYFTGEGPEQRNEKWFRQLVDPTVRAWERRHMSPNGCLFVGDYVAGDPVYRFAGTRPWYYDESGENQRQIVGILRQSGRKLVIQWLVPEATLDSICKANTGFTCFRDLLNAKGGYRPTINVDNADMRLLADNYDAHCELYGLQIDTYSGQTMPKRAYRIGG